MQAKRQGCLSHLSEGGHYRRHLPYLSSRNIDHVRNNLTAIPSSIIFETSFVYAGHGICSHRSRHCLNDSGSRSCLDLEGLARADCKLRAVLKQTSRTIAYWWIRIPLRPPEKQKKLENRTNGPTGGTIEKSALSFQAG